MRHAATTRRHGMRVQALVAAAVLIAAGMITRASLAAFTATTTNGTDSWTTASVVLSDDDTGSARFTATGMVPGGVGATDTKCIKVTHSGTATVDIRMYATLSNDTGLSTYLTFTVEEGTGGTFANCAGFVAGSTLYNAGTLSDFATNHANWTNGVSSWQAAGGGNKTYRITYALQDNNSAQGKAVDAVFTWEARNA